MSITENAAPTGRRDGDNSDRDNSEIIPKNSAASTLDRTISGWLIAVELSAPPTCAANSDRRLAATIAAAGGRPLVATIAEIGRRSGMGKAAVRAALRRMERRGLVRYDSQPGRGLKTVVAAVLSHGGANDE